MGFLERGVSYPSACTLPSMTAQFSCLSWHFIVLPMEAAGDKHSREGGKERARSEDKEASRKIVV